MSDEAKVTFADLLSDAIERWYESDSDFARKAEVSSSAVSRWIGGSQVPKPDTIRKMASWIKDVEGKPLSAAYLLEVAYPEVFAGRAPSSPRSVRAPIHPLALEVTNLLAENSPLPDDMRGALVSLLEHVITPYRPYLRKRKAA